jgi:cell wall-associated NlpC family hydrolase
MRIAELILCGLFLSASHTAVSARTENPQPDAWSTDVIGITEMHLSENYWVEKAKNAAQLLKSQEEITALKKEIYATNPYMVNLAQHPQRLSANIVKEKIQSISKPNKSDLYNPGGHLLTEQDYRKYTANLNLENIPETVQVEFALVVDRSDMRAYPTDDRFYKEREGQNLDRFQENGLFPGDALAVLHISADKEWAFVQSYNYAAWVRRENFAIGDRQLIQEYKDSERFLMITGDKVWTSFNPQIPALSELQLDMGIRIPLADRDSIDNNVYGQNPYTSYTVLLPLRSPEGALEIKQALIARNQDVHKGFLPFTRENIIRQAFKFLGERYGWGHSLNARDCTGFVMEVYKAFGIYMPRNTGQQGSSNFGENTRFTEQTTEAAKLEAFKKMDIGDLIYVPGHVLMYIGSVDGEPYVIHDVSIFRYTDANGEYYEGTLNSVSVTPLIPLYGSRESTYVELMYNIKRVR